MTALQPGVARYRPPRHRPSQPTYGACLDDAARQLRRHAESAIAASQVSETERIHRLLFSHYATPHSSPLRQHGSNR